MHGSHPRYSVLIGHGCSLAACQTLERTKLFFCLKFSVKFNMLLHNWETIFLNNDYLLN